MASRAARLGGDGVVRLGPLSSQPPRQRRAEVEADAPEVAGRGIRSVALGGDAVVPVPVRGGAALGRGQAA